MAKRFVTKKDNIRDNLINKDLFDLEADGEKKYTRAIVTFNRLWEGYTSMQNANRELLADREIILSKLDGMNFKKTKKDDLVTLLEEIEKTLKP